MDDGFGEVSVRVVAETAEFRQEIDELRASMSGNLSTGAAAAGRGIETALARAARVGRLEFEELSRVAARALGQIAGAALSGGGTGGIGGFAGLLSGALGGAMGLPGRALGGLVSPGRPYIVGERGPEVFVPASSGRVETGGAAARGAITINVNVAVPQGASDAFMARSSAQVARAVRRALERQEL
jgi:uncharacterized protein YgbK (DUF1537 family)